MKLFLSLAALSGFLAVAIGAFGAHLIKEKLELRFYEIYQTGVQYHFYHTIALLAIAVLLKFYPDSRLLTLSGWFFVAGIIIFSGSLYALSLSGITKLGAITPIGGLCFLAGWGLLLYQAIKL